MAICVAVLAGVAACLAAGVVIVRLADEFELNLWGIDD